MSIAGKVWGMTTLLLKTPMVEVHRLDVVPNAYCSMHKHERKWNAFVILSGALTIEVEKPEYGLTDKTVLRAGDLTTVKPGEYHRFVSGLTPTVALEIYYPETLSEDIVRLDCGGVLDSNAILDARTAVSE